MPELNIEPSDEIQERTLPVTIALRIGATLLGAFFGFAFFIGAYASISLIDTELLGEEQYVMVRFVISILFWTFLGLLTPFSVITRTFGLLFGSLQGTSGSGRLISFGRLAVFVLVLFVFVFLYWHVLGFLAPPLDSLFSE
jgi:hypothetical protein